jgi:hypothetical protein
MKKLSVMLLMAAVALAGELTGKWSGSFDAVNPDGSTNPGPAYMDLKIAGQAVTGTAGPSETDQKPISNGRLEGSKLTFEVVMGPGATLKFDLTFDGESIKGTATAEGDGQKLRANVDVKRKQ